IIDGKRNGVRVLARPRGPTGADGSAAAMCFAEAEARTAFDRISKWPIYARTPLVSLPAAAREAGVSTLHCKDEGARLGLKSFKALGALYASVNLMAQLVVRRTGSAVHDTDLLAGRHADALRDVVMVSATDGNHGFSLASAARRMGCKARIYVPAGVSAGRAQALRDEGADVIRIDGIYEEAMDAAVAAAAAEADTWLVSDYATAEYHEIPRLCMLGYSVIIQEIAEQLLAPPTHMFLPAGCGGLAASAIAASIYAWGADAPKAIVVEPATAACVFASVGSGKPVRVDGDLDTIMGGLACAGVSAVAWPVLNERAHACMTMDDAAARAAVRRFARPLAGDAPIVSGETGAAGLAAVLSVHDDQAVRAALGLGDDSRVLVVSCESATDPELYDEILRSAA
ncbi:MAG: diaminopropionate ammonia-lyase, partial [Parvibaculaceae bacterium]